MKGAITMGNTNSIYRLWLKEEQVKRSIHIDDNLYEKLQDLSENVFEASVSRIVNVAIEYCLCQENPNIKYYKKPKGVESIYRSILLKKSFYDKLVSIRENTGISVSRLLNYCIKIFLEDYDEYFRSIR